MHLYVVHFLQVVASELQVCPDNVRREGKRDDTRFLRKSGNTTQNNNQSKRRKKHV